MDYRNVGVDIEAGYKSMELMKEHVQETMRTEAMGGVGEFSGTLSPEATKRMEHPVLLSDTDDVGTKLKLTFLVDKHDTVGIDCVAMYVSGVAYADGESLFFLDCIAYGKNIPEKIATIVGGMADGCKQSGTALIGGETAEMPGFYPIREYDLAGFAIGMTDKKDLIDGSDLQTGDVSVGMASSGIHSNGFSLVRKVFEKKMTTKEPNAYCKGLGKTLDEALIVPTKIYVKTMKGIKEAGVKVKAYSHITGGGFYENIPRMLREDTYAVVKKDNYPVPAIFGLLTKKGNAEEEMMYNTCNVGLDVIVAVNPAGVGKTMEAIKTAGGTPCVVGGIEAGGKGVILC